MSLIYRGIAERLSGADGEREDRPMAATFRHLAQAAEAEEERQINDRNRNTDEPSG